MRMVGGTNDDVGSDGDGVADIDCAGDGHCVCSNDAFAIWNWRNVV